MTKKKTKYIAINVFVLFLVFSILKPIHKAYAYFLDDDSIEGSTVTAGTLDISLRKESDPTLVIDEKLFDGDIIGPTNPITKSFIVKKDGTSDFKYRVALQNKSGDTAFCDALKVSLRKDGADEYDNKFIDLKNYIMEISSDTDTLVLGVYVPGGDPTLQNKSCKFDLDVKAWQTNSDGSWGFIDDEKITENEIKSGSWKTVVINEIMWMGSTVSPQDEWVEFRNMTEEDINLNGWTIEGVRSDDSKITLIGTIDMKEYYVVSHFSSYGICPSGISAINCSITVQLVDPSVNIADTGRVLVLRDPSNLIVDVTPGVPGGWAKGENGSQKKSMERNDDPKDGSDSSNWHTCSDDVCNDTAYWNTEGDNYGTPQTTNQSSNDPTSIITSGTEPETPLVENADVGDSSPAQEPAQPEQPAQPVVEEPTIEEPKPEEIKKDDETITPDESAESTQSPTEEAPSSE